MSRGGGLHSFTRNLWKKKRVSTLIVTQTLSLRRYGGGPGRCRKTSLRLTCVPQIATSKLRPGHPRFFAACGYQAAKRGIRGAASGDAQEAARNVMRPLWKIGR
jgi:hypothetical protein